MLPVDHIGIAVSDGKDVERLLMKLADSAPALPEDIDSQGVARPILWIRYKFRNP